MLCSVDAKHDLTLRGIMTVYLSAVSSQQGRLRPLNLVLPDRTDLLSADRLTDHTCYVTHSPQRASQFDFA